MADPEDDGALGRATIDVDEVCWGVLDGVAVVDEELGDSEGCSATSKLKDRGRLRYRKISILISPHTYKLSSQKVSEKHPQ